jgi:hypothetical protein
MSIYVVERGVEVILINAAGRLNVPGPKFIRFNGTALDCSDVVSLKIPRIEIAEMKDMTVFGGGSWLLSPDKAIYPDLLVPERDVTLSEVEGPVSVDLSSGSVSIKHSSRPKKIPYAVSLLGQCSGNYAHWLTEILPKLLIIDSVERFKNFPLLVDEWVHPNFLKQINLLGVYDRAIILVGRWECVSINSLIEISPPAYLSAESREYLQTRSLPRPDSDLYPFSKHSLDMLRSAALRVASKYKSGNPKKLYLRRSAKSVGNGRMILNMAEVESLILSYGFEALDPAELSVVDQMAVFRDAECIISPVGAALANAIFTPAGCKVIALAPYYENANYYYYSNLMGVLGHDLHYVLGPQVEMDGHVLHRNYFIDLDALKEALERLAK